MEDEASNVTEELCEDLQGYEQVRTVQQTAINALVIYVEYNYELEEIKELLEIVVREGFDCEIFGVRSGLHGMIISVTVRHQKTIEDMVEEALGIDGHHHKQWYLHRMAERLGVSHPPDRFDVGIPP